MGDTDDPLGGQSKCDSDIEDRKVTPITGSIELIDFGTPDQPREIRIGYSLSPDERNRLMTYSGHTWMYFHGHMRTCQTLTLL